MDRIQFINYKGKPVLIEDFSNLTPGKEFFETVSSAQKIITSQPHNSVLAVLDATNSHFDTESLAALKKFVVANSPYIQCSAVVGVTGLLHIAVNALQNVSGRKFKSFPDRDAALEYVISQ